MLPEYLRMPLAAFGMASMVLGVIGLLLFFLPILAVPLSVCGLGFGVVGLATSAKVRGLRLRWSLLGLATCSLALGIGLAINFAPPGYDLPQPTVPRPWRPATDRRFIPPPAKENW